MLFRSMASARGRYRRAQIVIKMGITRPGDMSGGICALAGTGIGQDKTAIHDDPARVVNMPGQRRGVNEGGKNHGYKIQDSGAHMKRRAARLINPVTCIAITALL